MDAHIFLSLIVHSIISIFLILILVPTSYCEDDEYYALCEKPFDCGIQRNLSYPFWSKEYQPKVCGHEQFELKCAEGQDPVITSGAQDFRVVHINQSANVMTITLMDFWDRVCPQTSPKTIDDTLFSYDPSFTQLNLFYGCSPQIMESVPVQHSFSCSSVNDSFFATEAELGELKLNLSLCQSRFRVPVATDALRELWSELVTLHTVLREGYKVYYGHEEKISICSECRESDGLCGTNETSSHFACFCHDRRYLTACPRDSNKKVKKIIIGVVPAFGSVVIMGIILYAYHRRTKKKNASSTLVSRSITSDPSSKADMEKGSNYFGVHVFTYTELEEATNNFDSANELGDGGFGTVYYGELRDGRAVAVKRLYENNYRRVEQFRNEIDILTRLRHPHLVSLYGCTSRHSRELLLVYEYISNGTVADHLHGERAKPGALPWPTRMNIAVETARALTYLHASDIIHRDVKTNNILLDNNFGVKVADFGLSRLFPTDVTHVSTAPQGTPGYVDPEYHQCYQLTDKSDVYSFGVVMIELISSLPAVDITRHRYEINLSNLAINKIQGHALHELVDQNLGFESDYATRKMITAVAELAFQCLQCAKELRPSMDEVLAILEEIQTRDYSIEKKDDMDIPSDDVGLLKSHPLPLSPDSVTMRWISTSTTPNTSG